jgi:hypothetical protein
MTEKLGKLFRARSLTSCAGRHNDCLDADAFGHCNHWKGQEVSCTERVFGVCTNKGKKGNK